MKPREEGGVVDKRLSVYGTENLKCVDLSICPVSDARPRNFMCAQTVNKDNLGTNTYSSALLVGEKGSDLLLEELGECWLY